ncbi:MAG: helix-turn-helix transcriptional regulator [Lachnospiraceae bacterium]|nr:helix-turn-helix transcriptional regulator [Lachnospiraceae bacterium]
MRNYPVIDVEKTGKKLLRECELRGISTKELQQFLGLSGRQSIYTWFQGKALPTLDNFYALSRYLGVSMDELVTEKGKTVQEEGRVEGQNFTYDVHALIRRMMTYLNGLLQMY